MLKILLPPVFQKEKIYSDHDLEDVGITQVQILKNILKHAWTTNQTQFHESQDQNIP